LIAFDKNAVSFKYKDYRLEGPDRYKVMTLATDEFIRRFLIHVLPKGFHRIRHYGLFAKAAGADNIARARELLGSQKSQGEAADTDDHDGNKTPTLSHPCPCCGGRMIIIEIFERGATARHRPTAPIKLSITDLSLANFDCCAFTPARHPLAEDLLNSLTHGQCQ
jgi:hypothetical protein